MKKLPKPLTADQLRPGNWYYCNEPALRRDVQFVAIEQFGALEGMAYVEFKDDQGGKTGYYVRIESLSKRIV